MLCNVIQIFLNEFEIHQTHLVLEKLEKAKDELPAFLHCVVFVPQHLLWLAGLFTEKVDVDKVTRFSRTNSDGQSVSEVEPGSLFRSDSCEDNGKKSASSSWLTCSLTIAVAFLPSR